MYDAVYRVASLFFFFREERQELLHRRIEDDARSSLCVYSSAEHFFLRSTDRSPSCSPPLSAALCFVMVSHLLRSVFLCIVVQGLRARKKSSGKRTNLSHTRLRKADVKISRSQPSQGPGKTKVVVLSLLLAAGFVVPFPNEVGTLRSKLEIHCYGHFSSIRPSAFTAS